MGPKIEICTRTRFHRCLYLTGFRTISLQGRLPSDRCPDGLETRADKGWAARQFVSLRRRNFTWRKRPDLRVRHQADPEASGIRTKGQLEVILPGLGVNPG